MVRPPIRTRKPVRRVTPGERAEKEAIGDARHYGGLGALTPPPVPAAQPPSAASQQGEVPARGRARRARDRR